MNANTIKNGYIQLQCLKTQALNERLKPVLSTYLSKSSSHIMVLNFKHKKNCDQYWHLSPIDFISKDRINVENQLYLIWRLLTDSNLLKWNIFLKALFQQMESWRTAELVKCRVPIQCTNKGRQYDFTSRTATGTITPRLLAMMLLHAALSGATSTAILTLHLKSIDYCVSLIFKLEMQMKLWSLLYNIYAKKLLCVDVQH